MKRLPGESIQADIMGITHVDATVYDLSKANTPYQAEFLVDTGAIDCMAPRDSLLAAGITVEGSQAYELANGEEIRFDYGYCKVAVVGLETVCQIIHGPEGCEPILGVVALESLGLVVDPVLNTLEKVHTKPLK